MDAARRLQCRARRAGISLSNDDLRRLWRGAQWLAAAADASGISQYDNAFSALLRGMGPAISYFELSTTPRAGRIADLGCGNGAIGAMVAFLQPNLQVDLVDRAKRAYTTSEVLVARLGLANATAIRGDIRALDRVYDAVVFRALASGRDALTLTLPHIGPDGVICAFHRPGDQDYEAPPEDLQVLETTDTLLPGLMLTCYRR